MVYLFVLSRKKTVNRFRFSFSVSRVIIIAPKVQTYCIDRYLETLVSRIDIDIGGSS